VTRRLLASLVGAALLTGCGVAPVPTHRAIVSPDPPGLVPAVLDPIAIDIPTIGAYSNLIPTGVAADGGWEVPPVEFPEQASWYQPGPEPGEPGTAVVLGHVNGGGRPGVFARLDELAEADRIVITDQAGRPVEFEVIEVQFLPKTEFRADELLSDAGPPLLLLVTCGGEFDGEHYRDNVIVTAAPV
jgi:hypothetical protein